MITNGKSNKDRNVDETEDGVGGKSDNDNNDNDNDNENNDNDSDNKDDAGYGSLTKGNWCWLLANNTPITDITK